MNKGRELEILKLILDTTNVEIKDNGSKQPDFILTYSSENTSVGIEITELYLNDSRARLKNIDNYLNDIIKLNKFRGKLDEKLLRPDDFVIINIDGSDGECIKLIYMEHTLEQYEKAVIKTIEKKNAKYEKFNVKYDYMNLFIYDFESCLSSDSYDKSNFFSYLKTDNFSNAIITTCFDEIFFITRFFDGAYYIGLKLMLILKDMLNLKHYLEYYNKKLLSSDVNFIDIFAELLKCKGYLNITTGLIEENKVVNIGSYSIGINKNKENVIFNHYPHKMDVQICENDSSVFFNNDDYINFENIYKNTSFKINGWSKILEN